MSQIDDQLREHLVLKAKDRGLSEEALAIVRALYFNDGPAPSRVCGAVKPLVEAMRYIRQAKVPITGRFALAPEGIGRRTVRKVGIEDPATVGKVLRAVFKRYKVCNGKTFGVVDRDPGEMVFFANSRVMLALGRPCEARKAGEYGFVELPEELNSYVIKKIPAILSYMEAPVDVVARIENGSAGHAVMNVIGKMASAFSVRNFLRVEFSGVRFNAYDVAKVVECLFRLGCRTAEIAVEYCPGAGTIKQLAVYGTCGDAVVKAAVVQSIVNDGAPTVDLSECA